MSRKEKKRTLSGLVLRILPRHVVKLDSIPELCQCFFLLGVFLALDGGKIRLASVVPLTSNRYVVVVDVVCMRGLVGRPSSF